jgi:glycine cleavage system aminomethyltransferase T/glycine/D-amino acid oxidase-like deaminating enzyme
MTIPERLANREPDVEDLATSDLPPRARVVVVGGGIVGSSVAYHLTKLGVSDVVVLERGVLTNGTTWHAAGLVSQARGSHALTELSRVNAPLYESLPAETGIETGLRRVGSMTVARTEGRQQESLRSVSMGRDFGIEAYPLTPAEVKERWPVANVDDVVGGIIFPTDGTVNPGDAARSLMKGATMGGARLVHGVAIDGFGIERGAVTSVSTGRGPVECETVVLAAGLWSGELARLAGASLPLYPAEHYWVMTEPAEGAEETFPFLRDLDGYFYVRHYRGGYLVGAFEPKGKPRAVRSISTEGFEEFGPDWDHFAPVLANARERLPVLESVGFSHFLSAPESFTPDANFLLGPVPDVRGLHVACGFNSQGIIYGPGAGKALAEWIVEGHPTMDLADVDVARSGRWSNNRAWLHARTYESLGKLYAMHWPNLQPETARGVRRTPLYDRLKDANACFGEAAGWERANWFAPDGVEPVYGYAFGKQNWFDFAAEECRAAREEVALFDLSTYTKLLVQGPGALAGLERVCASEVDVPVGKIVYTTWCNERGGVEMDPTVTRLGDDRFLVVAPTATQTRTPMWLRAHLPADATIADVTSGYAVLAIMGPRARDLLGRLTEEDLGNDAFPFGTAKEIDAGWAKVWALRVSYVGELGWELFTPTEFADDLYDKVLAAGAELRLRHAGFHAMDALRIERGFRSWGHDVGQLDDPFAGGLGFTVSRAKSVDFLGHEALAALREAPRTRRLVSIRLGDPHAVLFHAESILRDGARVGHVTSGAWGYTLGGAVGLAWVHADEPVTDGWLAAAPLTVEIEERQIPVVQACVGGLYDPEGARVRM